MKAMPSNNYQQQKEGKESPLAAEASHEKAIQTDTTNSEVIKRPENEDEVHCLLPLSTERIKTEKAENTQV